MLFLSLKYVWQGEPLDDPAANSHSPDSVARTILRAMETSVCDTCVNIPDFAAANLREGERLPDAVTDLVDAYPSPEGFWDTSKEYEISKECPQCGQLYTYHYYYEFSVGYVEETVWIERQKAPSDPNK